MILTALVQYSRGSLILNLPRDRYDLALKLDSIGITKKFWDKLRIADDEDNEFSVKLFGENDIGKHLSLIFTENDTIFDVNKTLQILENSIEEIHGDLEMNIVHDQYDTLAELIGDIERMTDEVGRFTETFYFPLVGNMDEDDGYGQYEVDNSLLQCYEWDIRDLLQKEQDLDGTDMKDYFFDDDNLQKKMVSCKWDIVDRNDTLYGKVDVRLKEPLTSEEKEALREWIIGQNADGLGESLEQRPIETEDGDLYVSMWNGDADYFVYDEDEMNDYLAQQQGGGISQ